MKTAPVSDDELDQMIWKLERDGMTPKQLSLMKEVREVRRAKAVYQVMYGECWRDVSEEQYHDHAIHESPIRIVYTAPPAYKKTENFTDYHAGRNACRAAMLNHSGDTTDMAESVSNRDELPTQSSNEVNDAAWKLYDMLTEHGPLNGYQFNNLKECFYEALKVAMRQAAPKEVG